jgi:hypothetical protein
MNPRSTSVTSRPWTLPALFTVAALLMTAIQLSSGPMSSTSASNGTINIGSHPPTALSAEPDYGYWQGVTNPAHTPIIKG